MPNRRRGVVQAAVGAQLAGLALGLLTNVVYGRVLSFADLGALTMCLVLSGAITVLSDRGLQTFAARAFAAKELFLPGAYRLLLASQGIAVAASVSLAILIAITPELQRTTGLDGARPALIPELAVTMFAFQWSVTLLQGLERFNARALAILTNAGLTAMLTVALLPSRPTLEIAVHATSVAYAAVALMVFAACRRVAVSPQRDASTVSYRSAARQATPIFMSGIIAFLTTSGDSLFARAFLTLEEVGQYSVLRKLAGAALAPLIALLPLLFTRMSSQGLAERRRTFNGTHRFLAIALVVAAPLSAPFLSAGLEGLLGPRYAQGGTALLVLGIAAFVQVTYGFYGYFLTASKRYRGSLLINAGVFVVLALSTLFASSTTGRAGLPTFTIVLLASNCAGLGLAVGLTASDLPVRRTLLTRYLPIFTAVGAAGLLAGASLELAGTLVLCPLAAICSGALFVAVARNIWRGGAVDGRRERGV